MSRQDEGAVSRRTVIGAVGASAAASVLTTGSREAQAFSVLRSPEVTPTERTVPTFCELCFWNCGVLADVSKNRVLALRGHPDAPSSMGRLCGRGNAGAGFLRDQDRLKFPMIRVGERGEGKFKRVGWKTAYQTIARGFKKIKDEHGAKALALFYHGSGGPLMRKMLVAYGSPNYAAPSYAQCRGPRDVGYKLTIGRGPGSPEPLDFEKTQCIVLFGSHLGENAHNSQVQDFVRARARGAKLIVLDPRMSTVASRADVWLPVKTGSDTAILLAWMHLLITRDTYHHAFVENQCTGFEQLAEHVKPFTPAWAAEQAQVPVEDIVKAYDLMVKAMPAVVVHPGRHVTWYGEADTQRARAQAILSALLGAIWAPGGLYHPASAPSLKDFPSPDFPDLPENVDKAAKRFPFAVELTTNGIREATRTGVPYPIKGWFVHGSNLIQSLPNQQETFEAIRSLDMLVVTDIQPTEITDWADVVLPEDNYLERYDDLKTGGNLRPYIAIRQPVVKSHLDTRPAWRIAKELGTELGVGEFFGFETFEEYLSARLEGSGVTLAELKEKGFFFPKSEVKPYLDPREPNDWKTPSGKVELYSKQLADAGFDPMPKHTPPPDPPKGFLRLTYGRSPLHTFGRTQNNDILHDLNPGNCVWLHPMCAAALGVQHGKPVFVQNAHGDVTGPMPARVTERIRPQTVYMIHGFGHSSKGLTNACCMGGSDAELIRGYVVDGISGSTGMRTEFVKVTPAEGGKEKYPCAMG